jgi:L-alanine-DL-glutamate epimerase-like enolase superfamily enzyme
MKIIGYKTFLVDAFRTNCMFVELLTGSGYEGLGEATVEWNEKAVAAAIEKLGEFLVDKDPFADVRASSPIPIVTGERYFEPERFTELITKRAVDILPPDVGHVGGMLEAQKIAAMAHARFLPVAPHNSTGPVMNAMPLHLAASIPNFCILEPIAVDVPWRKEIVRESLPFNNSEIKIPNVPRLGLELDEEACGHRLYIRRPIPNLMPIP